MASNIGLIGLGTMGQALAMNMAEKGFHVGVFNRTNSVTRDFVVGAGDLSPMLKPSSTLEELVADLETPKSVILMVPAGDAVDDMISSLRPLLSRDDLIIDAGNANFHDTRRRSQEAGAGGSLFIGIGVSGGEEGARHGPSIMGGGPQEAWTRVEPILTAIAAKHRGAPCATWFGQDGAGHFVKTVHNGIEYADMQMIAEVYGIMRDGLGMSAAEIGEVFEGWNKGVLRSYLIEISGIVAKTVDPGTGTPLLDVILDRAGQKGTGRWTAIEALQLGAPASTIEAAVAARNLSSRLDERADGAALFGRPARTVDPARISIEQLETALLAGKICCYAQGFGILDAASEDYKWDLSMPAVAEVWRAGCIIRSDMLDDMAASFRDSPGVNLMRAPRFADHLRKSEGSLRQVVAEATLSGLPVPALAAGLAYFDQMRLARGTANMIQGQRDFFGAHSFERVDRPGAHHGPWAGG